MQRLFSFCILYLAVLYAQSQNVGVGTITPAARLTIQGPAGNPTIPGVNSTGIFRVTNTQQEGIDFGKISAAPFSAWIQAGFQGNTTDPISLQPLGGSVGIGIIAPASTAVLDVSSTTRGVLLPVMTKVQRDAIANPANGLMVTCSDCDQPGLHQFVNGEWKALIQNETTTIGNYGTVVNPKTGKIWLDRNLGASRVATSITDAEAFGDLYQWGRSADGHQVRTSPITNTIASDWRPTSSSAWHGRFITTMGNWFSSSATTLWIGRGGENNPCPSGFRLPTLAEWNQERLTWVSNDAAGAFASPLKLTMADERSRSNGALLFNGGFYWSSSMGSEVNTAGVLAITTASSGTGAFPVAIGLSVRCIKD
jgi:hypothetical protein